MEIKQNKTALKLAKKLTSLSFEKLQRYVLRKNIKQFIVSQLNTPNSSIIFNTINKIGKDDLQEGWRKQEMVLKFVNDVCSSVAEEFLYGDLTSFFRVLWDNIAGFFGVDAPCEKERYLQSSIILKILLALNERKRKTIILDIFNALEQATYLASGSNRYAPLAIFVTNLFNGTNIYSLEHIDNKEEVNSFLKNHLFYNKNAKFQAIEYRENMHFPNLPNVRFCKPSISSKEVRWLDIGCAPKVNGSPTLRLIKHILENCNALKQQGIKFSFFGTDIFFPYYFYDATTKNIKVHKVFSPLNDKKEHIKHQGIVYLNAKHKKYDVTNDNFINGEEEYWDFISACKIMHNFTQDQQIKKRSLARYIKIKNKNTRILWIDFVPYYYLSKKQQTVIENSLRSLKVGGYFFLDLSNPYKTNKYFINYNFFLIITRVSAQQFKLHDVVIPYDPDNNKVYPHHEYILHNKEFTAKKFGVKEDKYQNFGQDYQKLQQLMRQLDIYVYFLQSKDNIPNYYLHQSARAFKEGISLSKACEKYLQGVYNIIERGTKKNNDIYRKIKEIVYKIKKMENKYQQIKDVINVMLIGCGGAARDSYLPGIYNITGANLATIVIPGDEKSQMAAIEQIKLAAENLPNDKNLKQFVEKCKNVILPLKQNGRILDYDEDWQAIEEILNLELTNKAIKAIIIGSPEGYHHRYIEWALKNNLHIACDKPLTSRIGVTTESVKEIGGSVSSDNKIAIATELINDYDRYINYLQEIEHNLSKKLQFEILTKKRYSIVTLKIKKELKKSPAKAIQIFTADGWWLTPAQLARTDIFTMYGMDANKSDGGKLVHTAAHFLDLAIMFAREGRALKNFVINSIDVSVCFVRGYDSIVRSNSKPWLDIEAIGAGITNENEKNILFDNYFEQIKRLPEVNLALQIKISFSNDESMYIQLMGLHENLAKMANTSDNYSKQFQSRTKVDHIFILQDNNSVIEYKRFGKIDPVNPNDTIGGMKHQELYINSKKIPIPYEYNLDAKPISRFLQNVILTELPNDRVTEDDILSYSHLRDHEFDIKVLALIYKRIAEHHIMTSQNNTLFSSNRQITFQYIFNSKSNNLIVCSDFVDLNIPFHIMNKIADINEHILQKTHKVSKISGYGIISLQGNISGGVCKKATQYTTGFDYLDQLISLVQYSYNEIPDERLIDWQIKIHKNSASNMLIAQVIFYGEKEKHKYIACQLQLMALNVNIANDDSYKQSKTKVLSLEISQGPFALMCINQDKFGDQIIIKDFYSKELMRHL